MRERYEPETAVRALRRELRSRPATALSAQERRLLELVAEGFTNRQIAERMFLAEKTIKNYVSNLLLKLGMSRRTEAAAYATSVAERQRWRDD
jgi:two-component system response regulator DevR